MCLSIASQFSDELAIIMYYESNNTRKYEFNVTWRVNTEPYFTTTTQTQVVRAGQDVNVTFATATDDESDPIYYFVVKSTLPASVNLNQANSSESVIEFTGTSSSIGGTYEFVLEP